MLSFFFFFFFYPWGVLTEGYLSYFICCVFPQLGWTLDHWQTVPQWYPPLKSAGGHLDPYQRSPWMAFLARSWTKWSLMVSALAQTLFTALVHNLRSL